VHTCLSDEQMIERIARFINPCSFREGDVGGIRENGRRRALWLARDIYEQLLWPTVLDQEKKRVELEGELVRISKIAQRSLDKRPLLALDQTRSIVSALGSIAEEAAEGRIAK